MGFWKRLGAAGRALLGPADDGPDIRASSNTLRQMSLEELLRELNSGYATASGATVTTTSAERLAPVGACVRIITATMAHLPLQLFRKDGDRRVQEVADPRYGLLYRRPNEWQTALEFRELMTRDLELRGNGYALKVTDSQGRTDELIRLHPDMVRVEQDPRTLALSYRYSRPDGRQMTLSRDEVFHLRGLGDDGIVGRSTIAQFRETFGDALAMQEHGSRFFSNGAKPLGVLELEQGYQMGEDARKELKQDFETAYAGGANAHRTLVLQPGIKYTPISMNMDDAQWIESRKFTRGEIFAIFGIPPHKAGDLEKATFSNIEHQSIEYVTDAIVPRAVRWEQALERDLLADEPDLYFKHNVDALLRGDAKSRAEAQQIKRRNGVISANEWRDKDDMNPRPDPAGNLYIVESNMRPDDGRDPTATAPGATGT